VELEPVKKSAKKTTTPKKAATSKKKPVPPVDPDLIPLPPSPSLKKTRGRPKATTPAKKTKNTPRKIKKITKAPVKRKSPRLSKRTTTLDEVDEPAGANVDWFYPPDEPSVQKSPGRPKKVAKLEPDFLICGNFSSPLDDDSRRKTCGKFSSPMYGDLLPLIVCPPSPPRNDEAPVKKTPGRPKKTAAKPTPKKTTPKKPAKYPAQKSTGRSKKTAHFEEDPEPIHYEGRPSD
jgi:hypothetical protein